MNNINVIILHNTDKHIGIQKGSIKDDLDTFYKIIDCNCIDIAVRKINGVYYNIILDDEGALKDNRRMTMIENNMQEALYGTLIVCPIDKDDESKLGSFTEKDMNKMFKYLLNNREYDF